MGGVFSGCWIIAVNYKMERCSLLSCQSNGSSFSLSLAVATFLALHYWILAGSLSKHLTWLLAAQLQRHEIGY